MIKFVSFGSGSSGNCYYLNCQGTGIIIDAGIGIRAFKKYYKKYGLSFAELHALFITHGHTDHVKAAGILSQTWKIPVYASTIVHKGIERNLKINKKIDKEQKILFEHNQTVTVGPFVITSFSVPHDSLDNAGFIIAVDGKKFVILTDIGRETEDICKAINQADYLVIEANYDLELLKNGPYPLRLKQRICSGTGHLSNVEAGGLLAKHASSDLQRVWLCHLSSDNNNPVTALKTVEECYKKEHNVVELPFKLQALNRCEPTGLFELV